LYICLIQFKSTWNPYYCCELSDTGYLTQNNFGLYYCRCFYPIGIEWIIKSGHCISKWSKAVEEKGLKNTWHHPEKESWYILKKDYIDRFILWNNVRQMCTINVTWLDIWFQQCFDLPSLTLFFKSCCAANNVPVINVKLLWHNLHCKKRYINKGDLTWLDNK